MSPDHNPGSDMPPDGCPIRVGVIVDSKVPAWVCGTLEAIQHSSYARLTVAVRVIGSGPGLKRSHRWRHVLTRTGARPADALTPSDATFLFELCPVLETPGQASEGAITIGEAGIAELRSMALDVLLNLSAGQIREQLPARFGVWGLRHGAAGERRGLREFTLQTPTTDTELLVRDGERSGVLGRARAGTDPNSLRRGMNRLYWQSVSLIMRELLRLQRERSLDRDLPEEATSASPPPVGGLRHLLSLASVTRRNLVQRARDRWAHEQWFIAYRFHDGLKDQNADPSRFHQINPPPDRMWADPFIVAEGDRAWIFVEELVYREGRGVLAVIEADRDGKWTMPRRILERPYHLSYPCVFRWEGAWYMVPETHEDGSIQLFRATEFPDQWELASVLMSGIRAVDTSLFEWEGRWWMMTSTASHGQSFDQLLLFHSSTPFGPWLAYPQNPVLIDIIGGRCAGRPFVTGGRLYRAVQDGSRRYGYAMELREIVTLTPEHFSERTTRAIFPDWDRGLIGTHTWNTDGHATVIDGLRLRWHR